MPLLLILLLLLVSIGPAAAAAPTFEVAGSTSADPSGTSLSLSIDPGSNANRLLTSCVLMNGAVSSGITAHYFNTSETMTTVDSTGASTNMPMLVGRRIAPSSGAHDLVVEFDTSGYAAVLAAMSFAGVHQTTPLGTPAKADDVLSGGVSIDVASAADELVFDCFGYADTEAATDGSGTERWDETLFFANGLTAPGSSPTVTMSRSWDADFEFTALIGVSVKPVAGGANRRVIVIP